MYYNPKFKNEFLSQFNENTQVVYSRIFKKSEALENEADKDLYNFDDDALKVFMRDILKPSTKESSRTYSNILISYIQWAIENDYSYHKVNPIKRRQEYFYDFVTSEKLYISFEEKESIVGSLYNNQDKVIIQALFEGIEGKQASELVNLKRSDFIIDTSGDAVKYYAVVERKNNEVHVPISSKTYSIAMSASKDIEYYRKNGELESNSRLKESIPLLPSEYVLKKSLTNTSSETKKITHFTIYNRLKMIGSLDEFYEYRHALTSKNIVRSGMIYCAKKILDRDGVLGVKQIKEICSIFNVTYKWSLRDFLNEEIIAELYYTNKNS